MVLWVWGCGSVKDTCASCDECQRRPWHHLPIPSLLPMLCHLLLIKQTAPDSHFPSPHHPRSFQIEQTGTDSLALPHCRPATRLPLTQRGSSGNKGSLPNLVASSPWLGGLCVPVHTGGPVGLGPRPSSQPPPQAAGPGCLRRAPPGAGLPLPAANSNSHLESSQFPTSTRVLLLKLWGSFLDSRQEPCAGNHLTLAIKLCQENL